jgi:hypothetical protein
MPPRRTQPQPPTRGIAAASLLVLFAAAAAPLASARADQGADGGGSATGKTDDATWKGRNAFEVWEEEHRWFRLGFRAYGYNPAIDPNAALKLGAGITVPLTTDFFMGIGMKVSFTGSYNRGSQCVNRGGAGEDPVCSGGWVGGVNYTWREPISASRPYNPGSDGDATPSSTTFMDPQRRPSHVAFFALTLGGNYEVTIPSIQFFRVFQPFFGGGVVIAWVYTYSDIREDEFVLINNPENNPSDEDNVDPWSDQGPEIGGELYGGFHLNLDKVFRLVFELSYLNVAVPETPMRKATEGFDMKHLDYTLKQLKFGGGLEFRF